MKGRIPNDVIDAYYESLAPCPGCGAQWKHIVEGERTLRSATIQHTDDCTMLAQFDADDHDDEIAVD